jgi:hypothetical protein
VRPENLHFDLEIDSSLTVNTTCYLWVVSSVSCFGDFVTGEGGQTLQDE